MLLKLWAVEILPRVIVSHLGSLYFPSFPTSINTNRHYQVRVCFITFPIDHLRLMLRFPFGLRCYRNSTRICLPRPNQTRSIFTNTRTRQASTIPTMTDTRPVFFFDIDNTVSQPLRELIY